MAKCMVCGRGTSTGHNVSHARNRTKRQFKANLQKMTVLHEGKRQRGWVCMRCFKAHKVTKVL